MKTALLLIFALFLSGCCVPQRGSVVVMVGRDGRPVREIETVETVTTRQSRAGCLLGDILMGAMLVCADVVGIVFPIEERTEVVRRRYWSGEYWR